MLRTDGGDPTRQREPVMSAAMGAFWFSAIRPSVPCRSCLAIGTLAARSLATAGHQRCATVELPSSGRAYRFASPGALPCLIIAKFHYTDPTGPDRTRTDFFLRRNSVGSVRVSDKVRAGPFGSARVRSGPCSGI